VDERLADPAPPVRAGGGGRVVRRRPTVDDDVVRPVTAEEAAPLDDAPGDAAPPATGGGVADDDGGLPRRPVRTGWGPVSGALAPHAGVLAVGTVLLAILVVALLIALVGSRQTSIVAASDPAVVDTFDRPDGAALDELPGGGSWTTTGSWEVVGGAAYLAEAPDGGGRGFALLPGTSGRARIAATFFGIADDGGLVARYQGPDDHIALLPVEGLGTWRVDVVAGGEVVATQAMGLVGADEGMRAELVVREDTAWVIVDGQVRGRMDVAEAPSEGQVGLVAGLDSGGSTRFDDVARERP
jgi:hypothetical protein